MALDPSFGSFRRRKCGEQPLGNEAEDWAARPDDLTRPAPADDGPAKYDHAVVVNVQ